jgi:hypothetical protein
VCTCENCRNSAIDETACFWNWGVDHSDDRLRIRITRPREGEVDGVELETFAVGMIYEVSPSLGTYLIATDSAVFVESNEAISVFPFNDVRLGRFIERARSVAAESRKPIDTRSKLPGD